MRATCREDDKAVPFGDHARRACGSLEALRAGQERYLDVLRQMADSSESAHEGGSTVLGEAVASHVRLTRQFFAAQRSLLAHRADTNREVLRVAQQADADAATTLACARDMADRYGVQLDAVVAAHLPAQQPVNEMLWDVTDVDRPDLVAWNDLVDDNESIGRDVDAVFARAEEFDAATHRQLAGLLDEWWAAEQRECRDLLDDAEARAAMRRLVAEVIAADVAAQAVAPVEAMVPAEVPAHVEPVAADSPIDAHDSGSILLLDGPSLAPCLAGVDAVASANAADEGSELMMLCSRVLLPMMAATALLVGVLAWVG